MRGAARVVLVAVVWAAACWAEANAADVEPLLPNPILDGGTRWAFDGFSIAPPAGADWFSLAKTRERAVFAHGVQSSDEGLFATVVAIRMDAPAPTPQAFLAAARARRATQIDATRVTAVRHDEALEDGGAHWCTRYRITGAEPTPWYATARMTEVIGRTCRHPQVGALVVDVNYAIRGAAGAEDRAAREIGEAFLAGLRFVALPGARPQSLPLAVAAAEGGDPGVALRLGGMYQAGEGVTADPAQAEKWYRAAAAAGEVDALYNLGVLFERGIGRPRDPAEALRWFQRAADQRDGQAQLNLGLMHYKGDGVERNARAARDWLELAANNGSGRAKALLRELSFDD
jgi:hypothetical protein